MGNQLFVGPTRNLKTIDALPQVLSNTEILVDPGTYATSIRSYNWQNVTLRSPDPFHPAVLTGVDREFGLFQFVGHSVATVRNFSIVFAGNRGVVGQTKDSASVTLQDIHQNRGCLFWGSGGKNVVLRDNQNFGQPWKYGIFNADHRLDSLLIDNMGLTPDQRLVQQGTTESYLRTMQVGSLIIRGFRVKFSTGPEGHVGPWKQPVAFRSGDTIDVEDMDIEGSIAIGWMDDATLTPPSRPIQSVSIKRGSITGGFVWGGYLLREHVNFKDTLIHGKSYSGGSYIHGV